MGKRDAGHFSKIPRTLLVEERTSYGGNTREEESLSALHGAIREVILEEAGLEWRLVEEQVFARQVQVMKEPLASLLSLAFSSHVRVGWE